MDTDFDKPDPENVAAVSGPDQNHAASEGFTFQGEMLKPFTVRRQFAAQALGNKLLSGSVRLESVPCACRGENPQCEICAGSGERYAAYDGMFIDVAAVIYLCHCPMSEVQLAARRPDKVLDRAQEWAEQAGMSLGSPAFNEASEIYTELMQQLQKAQFEITKVREGAKGANPKNG